MKTVKDLINELSELDGDLIVGISIDEEGNRVNPWYDFSFAVYDENQDRGDQFRGYIYEEDDDSWENEIEVTKDTATAIVLWP